MPTVEPLIPCAGDTVEMADGLVGLAVCVIETGDPTPEYPMTQWGYLEHGVMVETVEVGLVHYPLEHVRRILPRT
jgi:hypothetical protein